MYEQFGLTRKSYRVEDIVRTASETAGIDLSEFFKKYVEGNETIPVDESRAFQ
jgi:predicted metalloprotease with PDZ domain